MGSTFTTNDATRFFFGGNNDQFLNSKGATFTANGDTVFGFGTGDDAFKNFYGANFNANGETTFFFDNPETDLTLSFSPPFVDVSGKPFTEDGLQGMDALENFGGSTFNSGAAGGDLDITSFYFGGNNDKLWNSKGATFNTFDISTFAFGTGNDEMWNTKGADFNATGLTTFFFDNPATIDLNIDLGFIDLTGIVLPIPFTESGAQGYDLFVNSKGATFRAGADNGSIDVTSFFFGGNDDEFRNEMGGQFYASELTTFAFQSGGDKFINTKGGDFYASGVTTILMDNPVIIDLIPHEAFDENGPQGEDLFENSKGATFTAGEYGGFPDITTIFFGGENDTFRNVEGATFNANDLTTLIFGSGDDYAYNAATINVSGALTLTGLETFENGGIGYGSGIIDMRNGNVLPDITSILGPGNFKGGYESRLGVDVFLGPPLPSFPFGYSDLLVIGGDIAGETTVLINKLNPGPGGLNPVGIDVVKYTGGATIENPCGAGPCQYGDAFYIDPNSPGYIHVGSSGAIEDGLFAWFMFQDDAGPGGDFELRGLGGPGAVNAPGIVTGAQNIFYDTLSVVEDHSYGHQFAGAGGAGADLPVEEAPVATAVGVRSGLWAKVSGSWTERDTSVTESMVTFDTSSSQEIYSVLGGADMKPWGPDSAMRFGLFGGYVASSLDFDLGTTSADYEGGIVGGYGAYNNGAFYADLTVKGDILNTDYSFAGVDVDADVLDIGFAANTGYRFTMGGGFVEPVASVAYVHSDVDDFGDGTGTVSFSESDSLRAGAGARVGATFATGGGKTELALLGRVWNEFEEANEVTVSSGGTSTTFTDDIEGIFGEVQATVTMSNASDTLSAFLSGGGQFGDDFTSWNARAGVRAGF